MSEINLAEERRKDVERYLSRYWFHDGVPLPTAFVPNECSLNELMNAEVFEDDVWVVSSPKCGTTWMQAIVALIMLGEKTIVEERLTLQSIYQFLEGFVEGASKNGMKKMRAAKRPRLLKSHLPFHLLPLQLQDHAAKVIYVTRNPKDACTSYYHFLRITCVEESVAHFKAYYDLYRQGQIYGGSWLEHVKKFWMERNHKNLLFVTYEQMSKDLRGVISLVAEFLGQMLSEDQLTRFTDILAFDKMKNNQAFNYKWDHVNQVFDLSKGEFLRKGVVGDWRNVFTDEMSRELDEAFLKPMAQLGLVFNP